MPSGAKKEPMSVRRARFEARLKPDGDCLIFHGSINASGYGRMGDNLAHRFAYELAHGAIPVGLTVDHMCYVLRCCNVKHLRLLTAEQNLKCQRSATKLFCKHGHPLSGPNLYVRPSGTRDCRACIRDRVRRYSQRKSA